MMFTGGVVLLFMASSGAALSNYAWREAQWQELRSATSAAILAAAAGPGLADAGTPAGDQQIAERVAAFLAGATGMSVDASDIGIERDPNNDNDNDVIRISATGDYLFDSIWAASDDLEEVFTAATVRHATDAFIADRQEWAVAVEASLGGSQRFQAGGADRMTVFRRTMSTLLAELAAAHRTTPGSVMMSLVPFDGMVNVADTCAADNNGACTGRRTAAKERYVRMLAGARSGMARTLADARAAVAVGKRTHWVDTFRQYGISRASPLNHRHLPMDLLNNRDWNLRRTGIAVDVSADVPSMPTWTVDDEDFWHGCVMARWGAYWDADARPANWDVTRSRNWPARKAVRRWSRRGRSLGSSMPLHLSDAPPVATDPNSLFTAYSWPDARIGNGANGKLHLGMLWTISPQVAYPPLATPHFRALIGISSMNGDMAWSERPLDGGRGPCPISPLVPLTADIDAFADKVRAMQLPPVEVRNAAPPHWWDGFDGPAPARGVVWALRSLSPLWQKVWDVRDPGNAARPGVTCAQGETRGCDAELRKGIILYLYGHGVGKAGQSRLSPLPLPPATSIVWNTEWPCFHSLGQTSIGSFRPPYEDGPYQRAALASTEAEFNARFQAADAGVDLVDANGKLNVAGAQRVAESFLRVEGTDCATEAARCAAMANELLANPPTPWQLFHTLDDGVVDMLVGSTSFNFTGRPTLLGHMCRPHYGFTVYGRVGDVIEAGDGSWVAGEAPFPIPDVFANRRYMALSVSGLYGSDPKDADQRALRQEILARKWNWLLHACRIAGRRGVRIHVIYGANRVNRVFQHIQRRQLAEIRHLERCVDAAGGDPNKDEVHQVASPDELLDALNSVFKTRHSLRFLENESRLA